MLPLQQYERLMKTLLVHHELAGPAHTLEAQRAANLEKFSEKTLGTLVKALFESDPGCDAALRCLEHCCQRIDHHHNERVGWVKTMDEARAHMAAFAQTDAFNDMVVNGIAPDGRFDWPHRGIVRVLREASEALSPSCSSWCTGSGVMGRRRAGSVVVDGSLGGIVARRGA